MTKSDQLREKFRSIAQQRKEERNTIYNTFSDTRDEILNVLKENECIKVLREVSDNYDLSYFNRIKVSGGINLGPATFTVDIGKFIDLEIKTKFNTTLLYSPESGYFKIKIGGFEYGKEDIKNTINILDQRKISILNQICREMEGILDLIKDRGILDVMEEKLLEELNNL